MDVGSCQVAGGGGVHWGRGARGLAGWPRLGGVGCLQPQIRSAPVCAGSGLLGVGGGLLAPDWAGRLLQLEAAC